MQLSKSIEFFDPETVNRRIHIIGCGSVGSTIAENLVRFGLKKITLYDFDVVEPKNIVNQMFTSEDIGISKVEALERMLKRINPDIGDGDIKIESEGYTNQKLSGYVFLAVDSIELRHKICTENKYNMNIKAMFDFRTRLTDAQHYAADWSKPEHIINMINSMSFTHEEAAEETPTSACGTVLGVAPTVRIICGYGVTNFINFVKGTPLKIMILADAFNHDVVAC